ncbi:GNAT family N-acetyltransferase [Spirosoma daeguense]
MIFFRISQPHHYLETIKIWYELSFPPEERRQPDDLQELLGYEDMHLCALLEQNELVGFIIYWEWDDIVFVEHFAVAPDQRGKQYGQQAVLELKQLDCRYCVLEVERPENETQQRRIRFYERQGFVLNPFDYVQPSYGPHGKAIPMRLMSIPAIESIHTFKQLSQLIKERVYERFYM